jgi:hypothetical protein
MANTASGAAGHIAVANTAAAARAADTTDTADTADTADAADTAPFTPIAVHCAALDAKDVSRRVCDGGRHARWRRAIAARAHRAAASMQHELALRYGGVAAAILGGDKLGTDFGRGDRHHRKWRGQVAHPTAKHVPRRLCLTVCGQKAHAVRRERLG